MFVITSGGALLLRPGLLRRLSARLLRLTAAVPQPRQAADAREVERLFQTYGNAVLRAACAYLHSRAEAEDVLQDTFLQYLRAAPSFESAAHEKAWLLRVAVNQCKNRLNAAWRRNTTELEDVYPCEGLEDELAFVWDAVRELPVKYREPIHLFYHEGYSTAEIAGILETKEATVRSLLHRGREKLKTILQEAYDFDD